MRIFKEFYLKHLVSLLFSITGSQIILFAVIHRFSIIYSLILAFTIIVYYYIFNNVKNLKHKGKSLYVTTAFIVFSMSIAIILIGNRFYSIDYYKWIISYTTTTNNLMLYEISSLLVLPFVFSSFVYYYSVNMFRLFMLFLISFIPRIAYIKLIGSDFDIANYIFIFLLLLMYIEKNLNNKKTAHFKEYINYNLISLFGSTLIGIIFLIAFILPKPTTLPNFNNINAILNFTKKDNTYSLAETKKVSTNKDFHIDDNKLLFSFTGDNPQYLIEKHYTTYTNNKWTTIAVPPISYSNADEIAITSNIATNYYYNVQNNPNPSLTISKELSKTLSDLTQGTIQMRLYEEVKVKNLKLKINNINTKLLPHPPNMQMAFSSDNVLNLKRDSYDRIKGDPDSTYFNKNGEFSFIFNSKDSSSVSMEYFMNAFTLDSLKELVDANTNLLSTYEQGIYNVFSDFYLNYFTDDFFETISLYSKDDGILSEDVKTLTKKLTEGSTSYYSSAKAIEEYLRSDKFTYSLNLPKQKGTGDYINYFILKGKAGYCVQYATAMTLMCRSLGIPTRYVTGYHVGEDNLENGKYLVKSKDAHAFVEVYLPGYGWEIFDPTPAISNKVKPNGFSTAVNNIDKALQEKISSPHYIFTGMIAVIIIAFVILGKLLYKLYMHITKRPLFLKNVKKLNNGDALESLIKNTLDLLQLCGLSPAPGETLLKFSGRVNEKIEVDFTKLVEVYYKYKYADEIVENVIIEKAFSVNSKIYEFSKTNTKKQPYKKAITKNL